MSGDERRRLELRAFLMRRRSRLLPNDVGLPATARRRVPGLRRAEVAELAHVTPDWYRWFESGRPVTVSPRFVSRLAEALRLEARDRATLFRLAFAEVYACQDALRPAPRMTRSLLSPIDDDTDIEDAARAFALAREHFLTNPEPDAAEPGVRPRIVHSWKRSVSVGVNVSRREAVIAIGSRSGLADAREANEELLRATEPVLEDLSNCLSDSGYALAIADRAGCVLGISGDPGIRRRLARHGFENGSDWSEASAGTNGIGTSLADRRPLQLMAAEHYCDGWQGLTCTAAPIRDPLTLEIVGALDITSDYRLVRPRLVTLLAESVFEIEERLAATARPTALS